MTNSKFNVMHKIPVTYLSLPGLDLSDPLLQRNFPTRELRQLQSMPQQSLELASSSCLVLGRESRRALRKTGSLHFGQTREWDSMSK